VNISFSSSVSLKCTPSERQMYPWGYMYPRLGTPDLDVNDTFERLITNLQMNFCQWWNPTYAHNPRK